MATFWLRCTFNKDTTSGFTETHTIKIPYDGVGSSSYSSTISCSGSFSWQTSAPTSGGASLTYRIGNGAETTLASGTVTSSGSNRTVNLDGSARVNLSGNTILTFKLSVSPYGNNGRVIHVIIPVNIQLFGIPGLSRLGNNTTPAILTAESINILRRVCGLTEIVAGSIIKSIALNEVHDCCYEIAGIDATYPRVSDYDRIVNFMNEGNGRNRIQRNWTS